MADENELLAQLRRGVQTHNLDELLETLHGLKTWSKQLENRRRLSDVAVYSLRSLIVEWKDVLEQPSVQLRERQIACLKCATESFRFLRNCCAEVPENQQKVVDAGVIGSVKELLVLLMKPHFQEDDQGLEAVRLTVQSGIQLFGNAVVKNEETQRVVWKELFPVFFSDVLSSGDHASHDCACMVIYNSLDSQRKVELVGSRDGHRMVSNILHSCVGQAQLGWGYFIIESIISSGLLSELYAGLEFDPSSRVILLDIVQVLLSESSKKYTGNESPTKQSVPEESLLFLATEFEQSAEQVVLGKDHEGQAENVMQALVVTRLLHILCEATALQHPVPALQTRASLTEVAVGLLHQTNTPENIEAFSNVSKVPQAPDSEELSPSHGFKRDLVRLIGNLCYQNTANQDKVRNLDAIPLLLDHCNVDDHNPYITQWAIFAIRNILQDNLENQAVITALNPQGLADTSRLQQFGFGVVQQENGQFRLVSR